MYGTTIPPERHYPETVAGRQMYWLLTIHYGSEMVRISTNNLDVFEEATGKTHRYHAGLGQLRYSDRIGLVGEVNEGSSTAIDVLFPVPVAEREAAGQMLAGARAELARWIHGTDLSERRVIVVGEVSEPIYGTPQEPVAFSLEAVVWRESVQVPTAVQRVNSRNWSFTDTLDEGEIGKYYPVVFGTPGKVSANIVARGWITGSRARRCDRSRIQVLDGGGTLMGFNGLRAVLAGHPVQATRVWVSTNAYPAGQRFGVVQVTDDRGQIVSVLDATPDGSTPGTGASSTDWEVIDPDGNPTYGLGRGTSVGAVIDASYQPKAAVATPGRFDLFVGWYNDAEDVGGSEGGMVGPDGTVIRGAGDVMLWMLSRTNKPVDFGRFAAAAPLLAQFKIDAIIDKPVYPWVWLRTHLLPILPVSIAMGPGGLYPIVWRYDATRAEAFFTMNTSIDPRIQRVGGVRVDNRRIVNEFTLEYAHSIRTGNFFGQAATGGKDYDSANTDYHPSLACKISQHRFRYPNGAPRIVEKALQSRVIYDDATARAVLAWQVAAHALGSREVAYLVPEKDWSWLERGMVGIIQDPEISIDWLVIVTDVQILDDDLLGVEMRYLENSVRDARTYG